MENVNKNKNTNLHPVTLEIIFTLDLTLHLIGFKINQQ